MKRFLSLLCVLTLVIGLGVLTVQVTNALAGKVKVENCTNGRDDDRDGATDCDDSDCDGHPDCTSCVPETEICDDGIDNDCDTDVDCADSDCTNDPICDPICVPETEIPCDGVDQDCDGSDLVDCGAQACSGDPACAGGPENCKDGIDNDGDGNTDCADNECTSDPACTGALNASHRGINSYDGPATCIACHNSAGNDMMNSVHGSWLGATPDVPNISGNAGKWGASNNYCTDPEMADYGCLRCHVSLVGPPGVATAEDMDCLACHQNAYDATFEPSQPVDKTNCVDGGTKTYLEPVPEADGKYRKHPRYDLMPAGATMIEMARLVHRPNNESCLMICHSDAGGGDGIKRGDLDSAMVDPPFTLDVHLSSAGTAQMTCTACHATTNHQIPGRGNDLRPTDTGATMKQCVDCHVGMDTGGGHASAGKRNEPDRHIARVDCTGCHIQSFGNGIPTEMTRDWTTPKWSAGGCEGQGAWVGTTTKGSDVTPTYRFWTGDSWVYDRNGNEGLSPDADDNGTLRYSYPIGGINSGKLYPFKVHESMNPVEDGTNMTNFDVMQQFFTGCYDDAARDGLDYIGATGSYTWKNTKAYQLITHGIGPAADANDCAKCHHSTPDLVVGTESKLDAIGYALKDADLNGVVDMADKVIICSQCHQDKSLSKNWEGMHTHTAKGSGIGCTFCHDFERPERNLCEPCNPDGSENTACINEFVDTNYYSHCDSGSGCTPSGPEVCTGGVDEDCNGAVDCADAACTDDPVCQEPPACTDYSDQSSCQAAGCRWSSKKGTCR